MPARTDQHQHEQTPQPGRSVYACVGAVAIWVIVACVALACWFAIRPSAWDKADWGQLKGLSKTEVLSLHGDPDPTPMIARWDMTFTTSTEFFDAATVHCLALQMQDGMVIDWAEFKADKAAPGPNWKVTRIAGAQQ